ncbi:hypothetical protein GQR58_024443 [Nymphon striatum]|nr:hypothetical protein GQR58_024443 [Nymphon striatum]
MLVFFLFQLNVKDLGKWGDRFKKFQKQLVESALEITENSGLEEKRLVRKKRAVPLDDSFHHSYIFDILPDRIDVMTKLELAAILDAILIFGERASGGFMGTFSMLLYTYSLTYPEKFSLNVLAKYFNFLRSFTTPKLPLKFDGQIYKKVTAVGIDYSHHDKIISIDSTVGDSIYNRRRRSQYRVWISVLIEKSNGHRFIDVYSVEDYQDHKPNLRLTYFVEHERIDEPYQTDLRFSDGSVTSVEHVKYGSRDFFLISNEGNGQYVKEIVSHGNKLIFEDFDVVDVPSGKKWLVVNIPGCRDEKLIYLFYKMHGVVQVYLGKLLKHGLQPVYTKDVLPVYYMAPGQGYFNTFGTQEFDSRDTARKACLEENACSGVTELKSKTYILGYRTGVVPSNPPLINALIKRQIEDGPEERNMTTQDRSQTHSGLLPLKPQLMSVMDSKQKPNRRVTNSTSYLFGLLTNSDPDFNCIYTYTADGKGHIVIKLVSGEAYVVDIASHTEFFERKVVLENAEIYNKLKNMTMVVEEHESVINRTKAVLEKAVKPNGTQIITGDIMFTNLTINKEVITTEMETTEMSFENSTLNAEDLKIDPEDLARSIAKIHNQVEELLKQLQGWKIFHDAVFIDEDALIRGTKIFRGILNITKELDVESVKVKEILGTDISKILEEIYRRDDPKPIYGEKTFENIIVNVVRTETLNGLNIPEDIVTKHTDQTIYGKTHFIDHITVNGNVNVNHVNGIDISDCIPLDSNKTITGSKTFTELFYANVIQVAEKAVVDTVDISEVAQNVLTVDGSETVEGTLTFEETLSVTNNVDVDTINHVDVSVLYENAAFIDDFTSITGMKNFSKAVEIKGGITLEGLLNGINVSDLFTRTRPHYFTSEKNFFSLMVNVIEVSGRVSGLRLPDDIVTLTTNQTISSNLSFVHGISVNGDIGVGRTVDGIDLSKLRDFCIILSNLTVIDGDVTFHNTVNITDKIYVDGNTNGFNLKEVAEDIVYDDEEKVTISAKKTFLKDLKCKEKFESLNSTINDPSEPKPCTKLFRHLILIYTIIIILGYKTFTNVKFLNHLNLSGLIDGVNITNLVKSVVTLSTDQNITSHITFTGGIIIAGDLIVSVNRTIDGVDVSDDLVHRNGSSQYITGKKIVQNLTFENELDITKRLISDDIDGVDISKLFENRVTLTTDQNVTGPWVLGNNTILNLVVTGNLNGHNITEFLNDIMSTTKDQVVTGIKHFLGIRRETLIMATLAITPDRAVAELVCSSGSVPLKHCKIHIIKTKEYIVYDDRIHKNHSYTNMITGTAWSYEGINGYKLDEIERYAVKLYNDTVITGLFTFSEDLYVDGDIHLTGLIDQVNLTHIEEFAVRKRSKSQTLGDKFFENGFHVNGNIEVGQVNGFSVPDDTLTVRTDQTITGKSLNSYFLNLYAPCLGYVQETKIIFSIKIQRRRHDNTQRKEWVGIMRVASKYSNPGQFDPAHTQKWKDGLLTRLPILLQNDANVLTNTPTLLFSRSKISPKELFCTFSCTLILEFILLVENNSVFSLYIGGFVIQT